MTIDSARRVQHKVRPEGELPLAVVSSQQSQQKISFRGEMVRTAHQSQHKPESGHQPTLAEIPTQVLQHKLRLRGDPTREIPPASPIRVEFDLTKDNDVGSSSYPTAPKPQIKIASLASNDWLDDIVVRASLEFLQFREVYIVDSSLVDESKRINAKLEHEPSTVPVVPLNCFKNHWAICVIDVQARLVKYINSLPSEIYEDDASFFHATLAAEDLPPC